MSLNVKQKKRLPTVNRNSKLLGKNYKKKYKKKCFKKKITTNKIYYVSFSKTLTRKSEKRPELPQYLNCILVIFSGLFSGLIIQCNDVLCQKYDKLFFFDGKSKFPDKIIFSSKIEIFLKNRKFSKKSTFKKVEILVKNQNFYDKMMTIFFD